MKVLTEVRCPHCNGAWFQRIGDAVQVSRGGRKGIEEAAGGKTYGCLECGRTFTVTPDRVFAPKRPDVARPVANGAAPVVPAQVRNPDSDIAMSPERMR